MCFKKFQFSPCVFNSFSMKLKFGSLITYSSQQTNWFDFWFRIKWGKIKGSDFLFDFRVVFSFQMFCYDLVWLAKNCGIWVQWCWICIKEIKRVKIKKKKKKSDCIFSFKNLINYFFKSRNKDFFLNLFIYCWCGFLMFFFFFFTCHVIFKYAMSSFSMLGKQFLSLSNGKGPKMKINWKHKD